MKLQFDPKQQYQLDAVDAVCDLFEGQPLGSPEFSVIHVGQHEGLFAGQARTELGMGNQLLIDTETLWTNTRQIQIRNDIEVVDPVVRLESWELFDAAADEKRLCPHFSVEMETGTGKTYVYLRTVFELSKRYGFKKFIIVVPSVAIREGVLKNIEITKDHFQGLYDKVPFEHFVYGSLPWEIPCRSSSSILMLSVRISPGPRMKRSPISFTRRVISFQVDNPSSSSKPQGPSSSSTNPKAWTPQTVPRRPSVP